MLHLFLDNLFCSLTFFPPFFLFYTYKTWLEEKKWKWSKTHQRNLKCNMDYKKEIVVCGAAVSIQNGTLKRASNFYLPVNKHKTCVESQVLNQKFHSDRNFWLDITSSKELTRYLGKKVNFQDNNNIILLFFIR